LFVILSEAKNLLCSTFVALWRGDREAEGGSLENCCVGNGTEGSNPSLSAIILQGSGRSEKRVHNFCRIAKIELRAEGEKARRVESQGWGEINPSLSAIILQPELRVF